jgi:sulfur transfer protein SufE
VPTEFYLQMGLQRVLSGQRLNGIGAILEHMKRVAAEARPAAERA